MLIRNPFPLCSHSSVAAGELRAESSSLVLTARGRRTPERDKYCSAGCSPELTCVGACSVRFLDLGAVPARRSEQNTRWNRTSWQQSTTVETCSDGCWRRSLSTCGVSMKWTRVVPTISSLWCLKGGNRPGTAHWGAAAARILIEILNPNRRFPVENCPHTWGICHQPAKIGRIDQPD